MSDEVQLLVGVPMKALPASWRAHIPTRKEPIVGPKTEMEAFFEKGGWQTHEQAARAAAVSDDWLGKTNARLKACGSKLRAYVSLDCEDGYIALQVQVTEFGWPQRGYPHDQVRLWLARASRELSAVGIRSPPGLAVNFAQEGEDDGD